MHKLYGLYTSTSSKWIQTSNFVNILQGKAQRLVSGTCGRHDSVQGLKESDSSCMLFLTVKFPAFKPCHLQKTRG